MRPFPFCVIVACACALLAPAAERSEREQAKLARKTEFWSFQKAAKPAVPKSNATNPIDAFLEDRRAKEGLAASPPADRRTLGRRIYFDLTGLPPTPEQLAAFLADKSPDAYNKLVENLLGSLRHGERWARYWLDIVHFGESHGYDKDKPRPNAWPYRDYVIQAANEDMPWSRFVQEQLAGDILFPDDPRATIATGFIAAGPWDFVGHVELPETKTDGLIARYNDRDDMVMTTMTSFLSLTVHCARCHDHKFDPITQEDYYRLQSVFAGVDRADRLVDKSKKDAGQRRALLAEKTALEKILKLPEGKRLSTLGYHSAIEKSPDVQKWVQLDFPVPVEIEAIGLVPAFEAYGGHPGPAFGFPNSFRIDLSDDPEFKTFQTVREEKDFPSPGNIPVVTPAKHKTSHIRITATGLWKRTDDWIFALGEAWVISHGINIASQATIRAADSIEAPPSWAKTNLIDGIAVVTDSNDSKKWSAHTNELRRLANISTELKSLEGQLVYAAANDFKPNGSFKPATKPRLVHLLKRGDVTQPEHEMEPGALEFLPDLKSNFDSSDDRRAQLAKWLTQKENVLLRRSIVNRVWQFHFGKGIVDSPNDFGHMGSEPTHPELLDWLAFWFMENGESLKALHRLIVTSAAYRQSSAENSEFAKIDADNRFLWRMNRSRLEAEAIRDAILSISGQLDLRMGGPSDQQFFFKDDHSPIYDYTRFDVDSPGARRRSIYRFIVRSVPDPLMETLDCPDPSLLAGKRNTTVTALQALATLNNPFILKQAEHFAPRLQRERPDLNAQIDRAFELALSRKPTTQERERLSAYAKQHGLPNTCRILFNMSEFMFID